MALGEYEVIQRTTPLFDGTADTDESDCGACGGKHPRVLPETDDGVIGGQGRTESSLRDGYVAFCIALVGVAFLLVGALILAVSR